MKEIFITEQELEYLTNIPAMVCEETIPYKSKMSFEEESKDCITLEQFSKNIDEAIRRLIPNP
jgi:hypothetical protein